MLLGFHLNLILGTCGVSDTDWINRQYRNTESQQQTEKLMILFSAEPFTPTFLLQKKTHLNSGQRLRKKI